MIAGEFHEKQAGEVKQIGVQVVMVDNVQRFQKTAGNEAAAPSGRSRAAVGGGRDECLCVVTIS